MTEKYNKEDPTYYGIIPADVRYDNDLDLGARLMFAEFSALTNKDGYAYPKNKYLADLYKVSSDTISRWINELAEKEYVYIRMVVEKDKTVSQRRIYVDYRNFKKDSQYPTLEEYKSRLKKKDTYPHENRYPIGTDAEENNTSINNTRYLSSDEDIDSNESIKEQEAEVIKPTNTDNTVLVDEEVSTVMNDIGMTKASELPKNIDLSWMDSINNDISDSKDISKTNKSSKGKERKSSAGKKESKPRKAPDTPATRLYDFYRSIAESLIRRGKIAPMTFAEGTKALSVEWGKINRTLLKKMSEGDAAEYLDYMSRDVWVLNNIGYSLDYLISEKTIVSKYNRMKQEQMKSQPKEPEYVPPAVKISRAICSKCGNELFFDGTCSICDLENYKK